jgi:TetR/AcrR family fatty acid metabolism transcriptional regulator
MAKSNEKKRNILAAAETVMSAKGLADSSISEIAGLAGVADSVIYQFFKGKEDLLFSIPAERMHDVLGLLQEQLTGIRDPLSRLRKMIWFHLNYNDTHRGYARLLLLECRTSQDFYTTPAYQLIRRYAGILTGILEQGKTEGVFRSDLDLRLARGCILGALDMENISTLASGEIPNSLQDFEELADLVQAMLAPRPEPDSAKRNKAEAILQAAVTVFAEKGFNKAKISDIAALAGVADGTVYEYFANKEDLLMSIPAKRFDRYLDNLGAAFEIRNPLRKLRRLIKYHFANFLTDREFSKIFVLQLQHNPHFFASKARPRACFARTWSPGFFATFFWAPSTIWLCAGSSSRSRAPPTSSARSTKSPTCFATRCCRRAYAMRGEWPAASIAGRTALARR